VLVSIRRVVPDISCDRLEESRGSFLNVLGFQVAMDPNITVEVDDVGAVHETAVQLGLDVVYPLTDEAWGVRRFLVAEPSGPVVNVMSHRDEA
jgi:hypothetical protein